MRERKLTKPPPRLFHAFCAVNKTLYLFGGYDPVANMELNDLYKFDRGGVTSSPSPPSQITTKN